MSKTAFYRQCTLKNGNRTTVSWIPEVYAVVGHTLKLKDENGVWEDGWLVDRAGEKMAAHLVEGQERAYLKQRAASDI